MKCNEMCNENVNEMNVILKQFFGGDSVKSRQTWQKLIVPIGSVGSPPAEEGHPWKLYLGLSGSLRLIKSGKVKIDMKLAYLYDLDACLKLYVDSQRLAADPA